MGAFENLSISKLGALTRTLKKLDTLPRQEIASNTTLTGSEISQRTVGNTRGRSRSGTTQLTQNCTQQTKTGRVRFAYRTRPVLPGCAAESAKDQKPCSTKSREDEK